MAFSFFKSKKEVSAKPGVNDVVELEVQKIIPNRYQPRKLFSDESIAELATTIAEHGLLQPIVVREYEAGKYEIIAGERRFRAVNRLKWEKIPALIKKMDDTQAASMAVIENLQREGLSAIEEAQSYQKLMELNQLTQLQLAREIGKSQSFVANKLRLLKLNMGVQRAILNRKLTERHGRALVSLDDKQQVELLKQIEEGHLTVKETEALVAKITAPKVKTQPKKKANARTKGSSKDVKIALNTIRQSVKMVTDTGLKVTTSEEDAPGVHRIIIEIPLDGSDQK